MSYLFRMSGRIVQVYRYQIDYTEEVPTDEDTIEQQPAVQYAASWEEAQEVAQQVDGTITPLNATEFDWMNGLEVADVPDTYTAAVEVYEMGEAKYLEKVAFDKKKRADQMRADLDYVMLMGGL